MERLGFTADALVRSVHASDNSTNLFRKKKRVPAIERLTLNASPTAGDTLRTRLPRSLNPCRLPS
jgi:hypothetical protein